MVPTLVTSFLSALSPAKKESKSQSKQTAPKTAPCASLSASVPASFAYASANAPVSKPISIPFPRSPPSTPSRHTTNSTPSSPLAGRERRGSLRRTLSRLSLGASLGGTAGSPGKHGRKDGNELRQPHYLLRRLQQEELEHGYTASSSTPNSSPAKSVKGRAEQENVDSGAKYAELVQLIGIIENSGSPTSPRPIPIAIPAPPSPSPARKLLKARRSLPLLSNFSPLCENFVEDETPILASRPRAKSINLFSPMHNMGKKPVQAKAETLKISYKTRPAISYPILIEAPPTTRLRSRHASVEHMRMSSVEYGFYNQDDEERTIRADTTYSTDDTIVPGTAINDLESFLELIDAFPSPTVSRHTSPVSLVGSLPPQLACSDDTPSLSSSSSCFSTPIGTPALADEQEFSFTSIATVDPLVKFEKEIMRRFALYEPYTLQGSKTLPVIEERHSTGLLAARGDTFDECVTPTARSFQVTAREERARGTTAFSAVSSASGFSFASFAHRLLVEDQPECRAPFYLEEDRLYWPQVLAY